MKKMGITRFVLAVSALGILSMPIFAAEVDVQAAAGGVSWQVNAASDGSTLSVRGEGGFAFRRSFAAGVAPIFQAPADGTYRWQLVVQPALTEAQRAELKAARARQEESEMSLGGLVRSGIFSVSGGTVTLVGADVDQGWGDRDQPTRDQVIADDLIVQGSLCTGFDCINNESFGFDTIRLKENSTRIKFDDTSTGAGFPNTDWQLTANDSASGGLNKFSIEDITAARVPFTVEGGATTNSLYVDSTGRIGFRTNNPVLDLHVATSNTPALRLEQNNSGGFTAQTWDIAGNEANFFVRDVTSGSRLPFRIRPGAPTSSIDISATGNVGIGTASPAAKLDVSVSGGVSATALRMANAEALRFDFVNTNGGTPTTWFFQHDNNVNRTFRISKEGTGGSEVDINDRLDSNGGLRTMVVNGSVQATAFPVGSSRTWKTAGAKVDAATVLDKIAGLEIESWRFNHEPEGIRHIGPYAEDFKAAFGLGSDEKHIELTDANGVTMVAIQELYREIQELKKQNAELREQLQPKN